MGFEQLFSGLNFEATIKKYCAHQSWKIADLNNRRAILKFNMSSGRSQTLFIVRFETVLEFSVPSAFAVDREEDFPHYLSTLLLQRSAERKIGFWCIEQISNKFTYSCMHNAEMKLLDSSLFAKIVETLISECDEFEGTLIKILNT